MDLQAVLEQWKSDCEIDEVRLDEASRITPKLHAKYLEMLVQAKLALKRCEFNQKTLLKEKWLYYNGKMSPEDIQEKGWLPDPFEGLKVLKGELDYYYDSDPDIQKSEEKIQYWKTVIETLTNIIDTIKWRQQTIGNMIKWRQFQAGA
jgi:hypothetical protein